YSAATWAVSSVLWLSTTKISSAHSSAGRQRRRFSASFLTGTRTLTGTRHFTVRRDTLRPQSTAAWVMLEFHGVKKSFNVLVDLYDAIGRHSTTGNPTIDGGESLPLPLPGVVAFDQCPTTPAHVAPLLRCALHQAANAREHGI